MIDAENEIIAAYRWILGRDVDPTGMATFAAAMRSGELDEAGLRRLLLTSAEFQGHQRGEQDRSDINRLVISETRLTVQHGPFAGLRMLDLSARGDGDISPKLLGTYERELSPFIDKFRTQKYDSVVDVGCAEGYFTVGFARMFPATPILAFDIDERALDILRAIASANDCLNQIIIGDFCDPNTLADIYQKYPRSLVMADCEGYEKVLFTDARSNAASTMSDIIIECHDLWDPEITPAIVQALEVTHTITIVSAGERNPNVFGFLRHLSDWDRWKSVWERRGAVQNWLICEAKAALI